MERLKLLCFILCICIFYGVMLKRTHLKGTRKMILSNEDLFKGDPIQRSLKKGDPKKRTGPKGIKSKKDQIRQVGLGGLGLVWLGWVRFGQVGLGWVRLGQVGQVVIAMTGTQLVATLWIHILCQKLYSSIKHF